MSNDLKIALIAAGASIIVSLIALATALLSSRQSNRYQKNIESLKFEFSKLLGKESAGESYIREITSSLRNAIQDIQHFKDEIQLILSAKQTSLDSKSALKRISTARERLFNSYEENFGSLDESEAKPFHGAKNLALKIEDYIKKCLHGKSQASQLQNDDRQDLIYLRSELTDLQQNLRDMRLDIIAGQKPLNPKKTRRLTTKSVLWIDDDIDASYGFVKSLSDELGINVDLASTTEIASQKLRANNYELIITDQMLEAENLSGLEFIARIRNGEIVDELTKRTIPVILLSGFPPSQIDEQASISNLTILTKGMGATDNLVKQVAQIIRKS